MNLFESAYGLGYFSVIGKTPFQMYDWNFQMDNTLDFALTPSLKILAHAMPVLVNQ